MRCILSNYTLFVKGNQKPKTPKPKAHLDAGFGGLTIVQIVQAVLENDPRAARSRQNTCYIDTLMVIIL